MPEQHASQKEGDESRRNSGKTERFACLGFAVMSKKQNGDKTYKTAKIQMRHLSFVNEGNQVAQDAPQAKSSNPRHSIHVLSRRLVGPLAAHANQGTQPTCTEYPEQIGIEGRHEDNFVVL